MKHVILLAFLCVTVFVAGAQDKQPKTRLPDKSKEVQTVETGCGQCQLGLPGKSCDLAVRINGKAYFVDGTDIDSHGDAHAKDGFCNAIRKAKVQGEIVNNRYVASYFELVAETPKKEVQR